MKTLYHHKNRSTPSKTYLGIPWRLSLVLLKKWSININSLQNRYPIPRQPVVENYYILS